MAVNEFHAARTSGNRVALVNFIRSLRLSSASLCRFAEWFILRTADQKPEDDRQLANRQLP
jgi:hypothetical protein